MAGTWVRYKEDKKYRKDAELNMNPKHVGESLRTLTLEDRLELRRQTREREKKSAIQAAELDDDEGSDAGGAPSHSPRPVKKARSVDEVEDLTVLDAAETTREVGRRPQADVAIVAGDDSAKPLARTASSRSATPDAVVVELDAEDAAAATAARRARRRASAARRAGTAAPALVPEPRVQVLE
mmetsp:Transcript_80790/g.250772  ORF Transcript_80790/g.250772 Transcript_80790/m.250772 type:complete len:183 (-) Transcript_80790:25-573(-)